MVILAVTQVRQSSPLLLSAVDRWHRSSGKGQQGRVYLTATRDAGLAEGGRGFLGLEGSWWSCWAEGGSFPEQRGGEPGKRQGRVFMKDQMKDQFRKFRLLKFRLFRLCANVCAYLEKSWRHVRVVEATQGRGGGRGGETWHPREGQQTREGTTSWTLKSTTEPEACGAIIARCW